MAGIAQSVPLRSKPELVIRGGPGRASVAGLRELWIFREVLTAFVARQVKVKYKQAAIGLGWVVIQPLLSAGLFAVFLGRLSKIPSQGEPYFLFALAGMVGWTSFSTGAAAAMESLVADQVMLRKVYFPREILPLAAVGAMLVDLVPALATLVVAALLYGSLPATSWLALPLVLALLVLPALGVGLALSSVNVFYRDVRYALPFVLQLGLFASPVVYSLSAVPASWRTVYAILNPLAAGIDGLRRVVIDGALPHAAITFGALGWSVALVVGGYLLFKRLERGFSDRV